MQRTRGIHTGAAASNDAADAGRRLVPASIDSDNWDSGREDAPPRNARVDLDAAGRAADKMLADPAQAATGKADASHGKARTRLCCVGDRRTLLFSAICCACIFTADICVTKLVILATDPSRLSAYDFVAIALLLSAVLLGLNALRITNACLPDTDTDSAAPDAILARV
jgi:hypothetical protein